MIPSSWHPASEQWGGAQIQNRFEKATGRRMMSKDMNAWTAGRIIGEAATRTKAPFPRKSKISFAPTIFPWRRSAGKR
jgi:hypothetical protein